MGTSIQNQAETAWAEKFMLARTEPMTDVLTKVFLSCIVMESNSKPIPSIAAKFEQEFLYQLILKRAAVLGLKLSFPVKAFMCALCGTPGEAVMYLHALLYKHASPKQLTMGMLAEYFPFGFLTQDELDRLWSEQKIDGQILLDSLFN